MLNLDFEMFSGDTKIITMSIKDNAGGTVDLTGASGYFTTGDYYNVTSEQFLLRKPITIIDAVNGIIQFEIDSKDTQEVDGLFPFDVRVTLSSGKSKVVKSGWMKIKATIAK